MTHAENSAKKFLQRWSWRKSAKMRALDNGAPPFPKLMNDDANAPTPAQDEAEPLEFDLTSLPPIESITAMRDIGAFLAPGVPEEITRAALRRLWVSEPTIRDFVGLAENQWDFTKPDSVPGFGSLDLTPELRRMVAELISDAPGQRAPMPHTGTEATEHVMQVEAHPAPPAGVFAAAESDASAEQSIASTNFAMPPNITEASIQVSPEVSIRDSSEDVAPRKRIFGAAQGPHFTRPKHGGAIPK